MGRNEMSKHGQPMSQTLAEMQMNELKMNDPKLNKIFDKLKKGDKIKLKTSSTMSKGSDFVEYIVKSKNVVNKGRVEKITLATVGNEKAVKKFLYRRDGKVTFAMGDMAASIDDIREKYSLTNHEIIEEIEVEELDEGMKYTHAVVDPDGKVAGMASNEKDAKDIASRHKGKVVKLKKPMSDKKGDMMINRPLEERPIDPADVDDDATDADKKAADKNIIMQMRKAMDVKGNMKIEFGDGKKEKVDPKILQMMVTAHGKIQKPRDKEKFVAMISKSKRDMLTIAKKLGTLKMGEELKLDEGTWKMPDNPKEVAALKKLMSRPLPIGNDEDEKTYKDSASSKLYGLLGDDELFDALGVLQDKGKEKADARPVIIKWFQQRVKDDSYGLGDETKTLGKAIGLKMEYVPEGFSPKEIKMAIGIASDPRYKGGNYTGAFKAIEKIKKGLGSHPQVAAVLKRQNEDRVENFNENYRKLAMMGIGTETKKAAKVGLKTDYYLPKNGDKSFGKITRVTSSGYEITDEKTKKVHKFKFYDPNNDPTSVRGTREEVELTEALKPKDKKTVDAFYKGEFMNGFALISDGKKLYSTTQTIATKEGSKFKIVAKMDGRFTQSVVNYIKKTFPKNVVSEEVELDEKVEYVEYKFKNERDAKAAKAYFDGIQLMSFDVNDDNIRGGELMVDAGSKDMTKYHKEVMKKFKPKVMTQESLEEKYDLYHKTFSDAMQHAYDYAKKKLGITVDPKEIDNKVATGPKKPSEGKTNKYRLKGKGGNLQIQVYNKGGSKPFELNMYKEENDMTKSLKDTVLEMWTEASEGFASDAQRKAAFASGYKEKGKKKDKEEGNEFSGALDKARKAGKKTFKVGDKEYPVKPAKKESVERYHETKQGSLRDAVLQMWGENVQEYVQSDGVKRRVKEGDNRLKSNKALTKEKKDGTKNMTDTGKEVTPVDMSPKMPKIKEAKNKV